MSSWLKITLGIVGIVAAGAAAALWAGSARWQRATDQAVDSLLEAVASQEAATVDFATFDQLPPPVAAYFRFALTDGQPLVKSARITSAGQFNAGESAGSWAPFEAVQVFTAQPPGFVWDAAIRMVPLMDVRVRDGYRAGRGSMFGAVAGIMPVVDQSGAQELNAGALIRYLAEAVWLPTALLPANGVVWTPIDDRAALATLTDSGVTASLEFHFDDAGRLTRIYTPERPREVNGAYEMAAWEARFDRYELHDGMQIPAEAIVEWQLPDKTLPYWKGRIVETEYDFGP